LQDERGFNADLGIRGSFGGSYNANGGADTAPWLTLDATLFFMQYADRIGNILRADTPPLFLPYRYRTNVGDARTIGVEAVVEVEWTQLWASVMRTGTAPAAQFTTYGNIALLDARYTRSREAGIVGKYVELAPPLIVRSGAAFKKDAFQASVQYSHTSTHFTDATNAVRTATAVNGIIPTYSVWDVSLKYAFVVWEFKTALEAGVNNALDTRYFTRRAESYPGPGIIPSDGRSWYLTLEVRF
jgi:Fe(3+) dicitrate transport protein